MNAFTFKPHLEKSSCFRFRWNGESANIYLFTVNISVFLFKIRFHPHDFILNASCCCHCGALFLFLCFIFNYNLPFKVGLNLFSLFFFCLSLFSSFLFFVRWGRKLPLQGNCRQNGTSLNINTEKGWGKRFVGRPFCPPLFLVTESSRSHTIRLYQKIRHAVLSWLVKL